MRRAFDTLTTGDVAINVAAMIFSIIAPNPLVTPLWTAVLIIMTHRAYRAWKEAKR